MSRQEVTGWRDAALSLRHRAAYGENAPMLDCDFVCVEYDLGAPALLVDYKLGTYARGPAFTGATVPRVFMPLVHLADGCGIPAAIVQYWPRLEYAMRVQALNDPAARMLKLPAIGYTRDMTERRYVQWLYDVRGRVSEGSEIYARGHVISSHILGNKFPPPYKQLHQHGTQKTGGN